MNFKPMMKLAAALVLMASCTLATAQSNWRISTLSQPGSVYANMVDEMADKITKGSGGAIKAERLYMTNEQEMVAQLMRGRLEIGALSNIATTVVIPEMALLGMPYLWSSDAERDFVTDNYALPVMKRLFEAKGLVIVGLGDVGWTNVFCKKACVTPADVKGLKVRVSPSAASKVFWGSLDTNGVQLPFSELIPGLKNGLVEAGELPFSIYGGTPAVQSAPHYVLTRHAHLGSNSADQHRRQPARVRRHEGGLGDPDRQAGRRLRPPVNRPAPFFPPPGTHAMTQSTYIQEYNAISDVLKNYIEGNARGRSAVTKLAFHDKATFFGLDGSDVVGPEIQTLYDIVDTLGDSP